ncbi:CTP-dependent diacylglycerol kinase 1 [Phytophthora citrophthora]|uniref:CTP-dependent diacylglycerol kinase 1 n=1 Tax=Phytophthora citrophthora TaxID=4793 RepID=A0AAD9GRZ3_9STRA|nr:CTP-dependent diacylglycerol kinase 1 [Phytophthora citrophthora]
MSSSEGGVSLGACAACVAAIILFQYLVSAKPLDAAQNGAARRGDLHLQRKLQHVGTGAMIYAASRYFGRLAGATVLLFFAVLFYGLHELRGRNEAVNTAYIKCFNSILRQYELSRAALPGAYYFLLGSGFSLVVFPLRVARLAILHLSVGDPAAAFFGTLYGRHKLVALVGKLGGNKSLEGSLGCFCAAVIATFTVLMVEKEFYFDVENEETLALAITISLAAGTGAAAAELLDIGGWDDNLTLPLLSGVFLQLTVGHLL